MVEQTTVDVRALEGKAVYSSDGVSVGDVAAVFLDKDTRKPEWLALRRGMLGRKQVLVPVADVDVRGDSLVVPYAAAKIDDAPEVDGTEVSQSIERALASHYGISYSKERSDTGLAEGRRPPSSRSRSGGGEGGRRSEASTPGEPETRTRDELYAEARRLGIEGRSKMKKRELARAVERAQSSRTGGSGGVANPIAVQAFLEGVDYPVRKADLVREATRQGAHDEVRRTLERIRDEKFDSPADVSEAIGRLS